MFLQIVEWGTVALGVVVTLITAYALYLTARYPTGWCNRVVAPAIPDDPVFIYEDDAGIGLL